MIHAEGEVAGDVRHFGHSKDTGGIARQFAVGLVQTADGIPLTHEVFEGNVYEAATLQGMVERVLERFAIRRLVLVADRGLLNAENLHTLEQLSLPEGVSLEYILAVPARRYGEYAKLCRGLGFDSAAQNPPGEDERIVETRDAQRRRVVVAHSHEQAKAQGQRRDAQIGEIEQLAERLVDRLNAQDEGRPGRGRRLSDSGAFAQVRQAVQEAGLSRIVHTDVDDGRFFYDIDAEALEQAQLLDGKLILVTNVEDLPPERIVERYKSLADIERGFRVLKSDIEIAPVYHRLPGRIRAHAFICFLALVLHRVMRLKLRQAGSTLSPSRAIELAQRIHYHRVDIRHRPHRGVTKLSSEQKDLFDQLEIERPTIERVDAAA
jgi:transposase